MVDYIQHWTQRTELPAKRLLGWLGLATSKFHDWKGRYGKANEHNGRVPRDWWLEDWEKQAILDYHATHPLDGYRRLTFMMLDNDVVAVSPSTTYRVLKAAGRLDRHRWAPSKKGTGFVQPLRRTNATKVLAAWLPRKAPVSCSRYDPTSTGTLTFRISTWPVRFTS